MTAPMPEDNEVDEKVMPVAWIVTNGGETCEPWLEYEQSEVDALPAVCIAEPLYSAATVAELRARADALAEELRHANKGYVHELNRATALEADAARYRFLRRKLCVTGNGDGTCAMQAINLPHRIHGWPEHGEHEQFFDAAIDSCLTGADPT